MPVYGIRGIESVEVKNANGDVVIRFEYPSQKLSKTEKLNPNNIEKVIFNPPATIVIFKDGTKEIVKCSEGDEFDPEVGFAQAMMNIMFLNRSNFKKFIKQHTEKSELSIK